MQTRAISARILPDAIDLATVYNLKQNSYDVTLSTLFTNTRCLN